MTRRERFRWRAGRIPVLLALLAAVGGACDDPLSPEEQRRLLEQFIDPAAEWDDDYGAASGLPLALLRAMPQGEIVVELDGEWLRFGAAALEYAHVPDTGHYGSLSRNRRMLFAWRLDDPTERFMLVGGGYPGPMGPYAIQDEPPELFAYRPHLIARTGDRRAWQNRVGRASFATAGQQRSDCAIVPAVATNFKTLDENVYDTSSTGNFRCEEMLYEVAFEAELGKRWKTSEGRLTLRMMPQVVPGIRMTRDCDGSDGAVAHLCGDWMLAPDLCVPLNPSPPAYCSLPNRGLPPDTGVAPPPKAGP